MKLDSAEIRSRIIPKLIGLGLADVTSVKAGKQNYVYTGLLRGQMCILKVADNRHRSLDALRVQIDMLMTLGTHSSAVCPPIPITDEASIIEIKINQRSFYGVAYAFAQGVSGDIENPTHVSLMGTALAALHGSMRKLPTYAFQEITELGKLTAIAEVCPQFQGANAILQRATKHFQTSQKQLIHGDFHADNLKIYAGDVRIFDFDNCAYGSTSFDVANSLYIALFDQSTKSNLPLYHKFRDHFLEAYEQASQAVLDRQIIDDLIAYRVLLLASWLARPDQAPLFVRQSTPAWLATLDHFVKAYFAPTS